MSISIPIPRLPSLPVMPDPDLVDDLLDGAGDPIRAALAAIAETTAALDELEAGRPGGAAWVAAREQDRALVMAGKPATRLAKVIAGDGALYATALACASTISERGRPEVDARLADAARQAALDLHPPFSVVLGELSRALSEGRLADAHRAREQGAVVVAAIAARQAVARWASGDGFELRAAELPELLADGWRDAVEQLDGVPTELSWRYLQARADAAAAREQDIQDAANGRRRRPVA